MEEACPDGESRVGLVWSGTIDSFQVEVVCYLQETHGVDMLHKYTLQGIIVEGESPCGQVDLLKELDS